MGRNITMFLLLVLFNGFAMIAQTLDEARELYKLKEFKKALPLFEKEYKEKPTDASLNQWYGVCLFETGGDLRKAEECITIASKKNIPDAYLYLGKIYTKTYRFPLARKEFDRYARLKRKDKEATALVESEQKKLAVLERSVSSVEDIQVIDSIIVDKDKFLSVYKLSPSSGNIGYYGEFFPKARTIQSTVYLNEKKDKMYYAKPDGVNILSLFSMEKLLDDFGNEKRLSSENFEFSGNLNYPFMMADGVTIYFAAEDESGFGGYDLYVTRYNLNNDTYLTPERLNMPFNSPFNDYMYVVDEEKGVGWFATDRFQPEGKVCVYIFIPNSRVKIIESEDDDYLAGRAMISSIKNSWKPGLNYNSQITLARKKVEEQKETKKDFEFVIDDKYTYYLFGDFKNSSAREMYESVTEKKKMLNNIDIKLTELRNTYKSTAASSKKKEILDLENRQFELFNEIRGLEIKARNQEINHLK